MKRMNKNGDVTSTQVIFLLIAVISFGIGLMALSLVDFGGSTERDICKLSVLTRATSPDIAQSVIPLKCRTEKICLTDKLFGGCEEQFAGEENVVRVRLSGTDSQKKLKIEEISANAMYDCWNMMGQGKLDLFGKAAESFGWDVTQPTCVICSRVAVDKDVNPEILNSVDINTYMRAHQV